MSRGMPGPSSMISMLAITRCRVSPIVKFVTARVLSLTVPWPASTCVALRTRFISAWMNWSRSRDSSGNPGPPPHSFTTYNHL